MISKSDSLTLWARSWASSFGSTHSLSGLHFKQPIQGFMLNRLIGTVSTECVDLMLSLISARRADVTPFVLGLVFRIKTFISFLHSPLQHGLKGLMITVESLRNRNPLLGRTMIIQFYINPKQNNSLLYHISFRIFTSPPVLLLPNLFYPFCLQAFLSQ
jgi:hypothetical protein